MKPDQYFGKSKGAFPAAGIVGSESEWMDMGTISVPNGMLWAGDLFAMDEDAGCSVKVAKGQYRVQIKGMDFKGHRRSSRVRAFLATESQPSLGAKCGEVSVDCGLMGLHDWTAFKKTVGAKYAQQYGREVMAATMEEIVDCIGFTYAGKTFELAFLPPGMGDGTYPIYSLVATGKSVGVELELLPLGFKVTG